MRVCAWGAVLLMALAASDAAGQVNCTQTPPLVCTTTSWSTFFGLMFGQPLRLIDFETLPNGQPSYAGAPITPDFNYTALGVTFTAPLGTPRIGGPGPGDYDLRVSLANPLLHTWLRADFVSPTSAAGVYFVGATTLTAFDSHGSVIASRQYGFSGGPWFIGIVSEVPIAYVTADRYSDSEAIEDFIFSPIPEPGSAMLLGLGALVAATRRRR